MNFETEADSADKSQPFEIETDENVYTCGKLCETNGDLKCDVHIHTAAKPYSCKTCSQRFARPVLLKIHLLKAHNERM